MGNHGVLAVGPTLGVALSVAEAVEITAGFYYRARCIGMPKILSDEEMARVITAFSTYGQHKQKPAQPALEEEVARVIREVEAPLEAGR